MNVRKKYEEVACCEILFDGVILSYKTSTSISLFPYNHLLHILIFTLFLWFIWYFRSVKCYKCGLSEENEADGWMGGGVVRGGGDGT